MGTDCCSCTSVIQTSCAGWCRHSPSASWSDIPSCQGCTRSEACTCSNWCNNVPANSWETVPDCCGCHAGVPSKLPQRRLQLQSRLRQESPQHQVLHGKQPLLAMQMLLAARKVLMVIVVQLQQGLCSDVAQSAERLEAIMSLRVSARWSHLNSR